MSKPPSFLFIVTDQHRADHAGFGGNEVIHTPNLDGLAERATRFDRAYVANPICMPNRSTMLTGRQPSVHGTRMNGIALDPDQRTFVQTLRANGWATGLVGKAHLQNMGYQAPIDGLFRKPGEAVNRPRPDGWDGYEDIERHKRERVAFPEDYYGFERVDLTVDHGDVCTGHYYQWLLDKGVDPTTLQGHDNALQAFSGWNQIYQTALPEELYPTSYVADRTVAMLEEFAKKDQPFFLQCSYPDPHHPFTPPGRFYEMYDAARMPLPETFHDTHATSLPFFRKRLQNRGQQLFPVAPFAPTEEQLRESMAKEYGMISMIDESLGTVLAAVERLGLADDTVIVFTSDHGDMFGDHSMMLKGGMHYEGCIRVPLLIARPEGRPAVCGSLAGTLDLAQTFLDLAGLPAHYGMQGTSLVPLLDDPTARVRDDVIVEEDELFDVVARGHPLRMRTIVTEDARLSFYDGSELGELFDFTRDRHEMTNLFENSAGRDLRFTLTDRLSRRMMEYAETAPKPTAVA